MLGRGRTGGTGRRLRRWVGALVVMAVAAIVLRAAEWSPPQVELDEPAGTVGGQMRVVGLARDRGTGLARLEVVLEAAGTARVLASESFPGGRWFWPASGVHERQIDLRIDLGKVGVPEGPARLAVFAEDHSLLTRFRATRPRAEATLRVDLTPPNVAVLTREHYARLGGSEMVLYRVSDDAVRSGVVIADRFFPGVEGLFTDTHIRAALFAVPWDLPPGASPVLTAADQAGNERQIPFFCAITRRRFAERTVEVSDGFLQRKVPEIIAANRLEEPADLLSGYLTINGDLRHATEERVRGLCRDSASTPLWEGAFLQQRNSQVASRFADQRSYVYRGRVVDQQVHLGYDLASVRAAPVDAANAGRVVFTGPLAIYGESVVIDHGMGLFSLYGHLSSIAVTLGDTVSRGDTIGRTGETGLAGGDHLHFAVLVRGVYVDPLEWWDRRWVGEHVTAKLALFPRRGASVAAPVGP